MTPTPERALELAEWAEDTASYFDTTDEHGYIITEAEDERQVYLQLAKIARHYAEILPKWQAVLDAEPVAEIVRFHQGASASIIIGMPPYVRESIAHGTQLIIKPAP